MYTSEEYKPHSRPFDIQHEMEQLVYGMHDGHYEKARAHEVAIVREFKSLVEQLETAREALERISTYGSHYTPHTGIARDALDALNPANKR